MSTEPFLINPPKKKAKAKVKAKGKIKHRPVVYATSKSADTWTRGPKSRSKAAGITLNPAEVTIVGNNPKKKKKRVNFESISERSKAAKKGWRTRSKSDGRKKKIRRNPATALSFGKPATLIAPIITGLASAVSIKKIPEMVGVVDTLPKLGIQAGIAFGVPLIGKKFMGSANAKLWTIVAVVTVLSDLLEDMLLKSAVSGIGYATDAADQYPDNSVGYDAGTSLGMGAFPADVVAEENYGAFPYDEATAGY